MGIQKFQFSKVRLNSDILFNNRGELMKIGRLVVENHSEGTMSQIFYLRPRFYFMKSRKLSGKNGKKLPFFLHKITSKT